MSQRKVGILSFYASGSLSKASIHSGLERHKNFTVCCIEFWTLLNLGIDVFSRLRKNGLLIDIVPDTFQSQGRAPPKCNRAIAEHRWVLILEGLCYEYRKSQSVAG